MTLTVIGRKTGIIMSRNFGQNSALWSEQSARCHDQSAKIILLIDGHKSLWGYVRHDNNNNLLQYRLI